MKTAKALSPKLIEQIITEILAIAPQKGILITDHDYEKVWEISTKKFLLKDGFLKPISSFSEMKIGSYIS